MAKEVRKTIFGTPRVVLECGPGLTRESEKELCDVNKIVERFGGDPSLIPEEAKRPGVFGDFTSVPHFLDAQRRVARARELFDSLSPSVRKRFDGDMVKFVSFLSDPENLDEAIRLGIVNVVKEAKNADVAKGSTDSGSGGSAASPGAEKAPGDPGTSGKPVKAS